MENKKKFKDNIINRKEKKYNYLPAFSRSGKRYFRS